jgi:small subunit ribosomal protein S16
VRNLVLTPFTGEKLLVAVKIKLKRLGKIRNPQYRVVIADSRTARNGRSIEEIGLYHPKEEPSLIQINSERAQYWLSVGAQPTEPVLVLLKITGDWQKFKGLPGAEGTLKVKEEKVSKQIKFAETVLAVAAEPRVPTIRPKAEPKVEEVVAEEAPAAEVVEDVVVEEAAAAEAPAEVVADEAPAAAEAPAEVVVEEVAAEVVAEEAPAADEAPAAEATEEA